MRTYNEILNAYSEEDKKQAVKDFIEFRNKGVIGNCVLRTISEEISKEFSGTQGASYWMNDVAREISLEFAIKYINEKEISKS